MLISSKTRNWFSNKIDYICFLTTRFINPGVLSYYTANKEKRRTIFMECSKGGVLCIVSRQKISLLSYSFIYFHSTKTSTWVIHYPKKATRLREWTGLVSKKYNMNFLSDFFFLDGISLLDNLFFVGSSSWSCVWCSSCKKNLRGSAIPITKKDF